MNRDRRLAIYLAGHWRDLAASPPRPELFEPIVMALLVAMLVVVAGAALAG